MQRSFARMAGRVLVLAAAVGLAPQQGWSVTRYVSLSGSSTPPYTNRATAATNIQTAINVASAGDAIQVATGVYRITSQLLVNRQVYLYSEQRWGAIIDAQRLCPAVSMNSSNTVMEGFIIKNGVSGSYGGGALIYSACTLRDCLVVSNQAWGGAGVTINSSHAMVEDCTIAHNFASNWAGGVVFYNYSTSTMNRCVIRNNRSADYVGAIAFQFGGAVSNCWIADNQASNHVGAVDLDSGGRLVNSVVVGNQARTIAGGVRVTYGEVLNCTIVSNTAGQVGGGYLSYAGTSVNNIVYFNSAPTNKDMALFNLLISTSRYTCTSTNLGGSNFTNAPAFANLGARNFHLVADSSCIDAGQTLASVQSDYDGWFRPQTGHAGGPYNQDVGAFEYQSWRPASDFNGNGASDYVVFNPPDGNWYVRSPTGDTLAWAKQWGWSTAKPLVGDYNGDGLYDQAVFDTVGGYWYIKNLGGGAPLAWANQWGWSTAKPIPGDYNGDHSWDLAVFDTAGGYWYIKTLGGTVLTWANQWGWSTAKPVPGDYNADNVWDLAVFDTQGGNWYIKALGGGAPLVWANQWGWSTAKPVPGDYNGDGVWDLAVFDTQGGYWYIKSIGGTVLAWQVQWGWSTAIPVSGDFNGDGVYDLAVYDNATGLWYVRSLSGATIAWGVNWGWPGATVPNLAN